LTQLGILGGTFDPPHLAHLIMAEYAREQLDLDRVLWVVAAQPPHKHDQTVSPVEHRLKMVELMLADNPAFELSRMDVERPGPHYTVDMLSIFADRYPGSDLFFLLGADSLRDLLEWHDPAGIIRHARLVVMERPGTSYDLARLESSIPGLKERVIIQDAPSIDISSSEIRVRAASGQSIRYLLPANVETYIHTHGLYRPS
jgi:nicotinate-nucleotide adenylyltransferase